MKSVITFLLLTSAALAQCPGVQSPYTNKICHIIIMIQENRSADEMFGAGVPNWSFPITPGVTKAPCKVANVPVGCSGSQILLSHASVNTPTLDLPHSRAAQLLILDSGAMDGWTWNSSSPAGDNPYSYFTQTDLPFYYRMCLYFACADEWRDSALAPSWPSHALLFWAGTNEVADNPNVGSYDACAELGGGCNSWTIYSTNSTGAELTSASPQHRYTTATANTSAGNITNNVSLSGAPGNSYNHGVCGCTTGSPGTYTLNNGIGCVTNTQFVGCAIDGDCTGAGTNSICVHFTQAIPANSSDNLGSIAPSVTTIGDQMTNAGISWAWYGPAKDHSGFQWVAPCYVQECFSNTSHLQSTATFLSDLANGTLPQVSFISPSICFSEHPGNGTGFCSEAVGAAWAQTYIQSWLISQYYATSLFFVIWDDNGGYFDLGAAPTPVDNLGPGFRVPAIAMGPYATAGTVVHTALETVGIDKCIEDVFGVSNLGTRDSGATSACKSDGTAMVNLSQSPLAAPWFPASSPAMFAKIPQYSPDLVDLAKRAWSLFHHHHDDDDDKPVSVASLKDRPCLYGTHLEMLPNHWTGEWSKWCVDGKYNLILKPGELRGEDADDADKKPRKKSP